MLGTVRGLEVADIGCGTGRHCVRLAASGASVTALDLSEAMLRRAVEKANARHVSFIRADLSKGLPLRSASFDAAICALILDHISNLKDFFSELRRICRGGGFAVISVMHPAMMLRGVQAQFTDPRTGIKTRPQSVPNQISDYVSAIAANGLKFEHVSEHAIDAELARRLPRARKYLGWPMLLLMRLGVP